MGIVSAMLKEDNIRLIRKIFAFAIIAAFAASQHAANADDSRWNIYESDTGIFKVQVPIDLETKTKNFRIDDERIASSSIAMSIHDQRAYKETFKSYLVRVDQTIGPALTNEQIETFLTAELRDYIKRYEGMNPILKNKELKYFRNLPGAEIHIEYHDPELGPLNTRVRIIYTDASRIEQALTGDSYIMYGFKADKFFETLEVNEGITYEEEKFGQTWESHTSPLGIFSVSLPQAMSPYVMEEPKITHSQKTELISQTISDPIWGHNIFYRAYGYKFDQPLTMNNVQHVLFEKHISKYKKDSSSFDYKKTKTDKHNIMETKMQIHAPAKAPYASFVRLRIFYIANFMVVQEIISSRDFIDMPFINNMMNLIEFHPEKAGQKLPETKPSKTHPPETPAPETPAPETPEETIAD